LGSSNFQGFGNPGSLFLRFYDKFCKLLLSTPLNLPLARGDFLAPSLIRKGLGKVEKTVEK